MPFLNARKKILGFTLIELLVVILIGEILSAIAIPSFLVRLAFFVSKNTKPLSR